MALLLSSFSVCPASSHHPLTPLSSPFPLPPSPLPLSPSLPLSLSSSRQFKDNEHTVFYVDQHVHPHSLSVIRTRADHLGVQTVVDDFHNFDLSSGNVCGVLVQYPNTDGQINDFSEMIDEAHNNKVNTFTWFPQLVTGRPSPVCYIHVFIYIICHVHVHGSACA